MNHQITLEELGIIPRQEPSAESPEEKIDRSKYNCFCGGCICNHCANSVECYDRCTGESDFGCFNCDDCKGWDGKNGTDNWRYRCRNYKITEAYANVIRKKFKALKPESEGRG